MLKVVPILLLSVTIFAQPSSELEVLQIVQRMAKEEGRITFSDLYNSDQFSSEQKSFLGRLYEIFFAIPSFLKSEFESTGRIPSRSEIGKSFGVTPQSIELLLTVMESDNRVPPLFSRNPASREIDSLNVSNIEAFVASKGSDVKMTQWEGQMVPSFKLESFEGEIISSADLNSKNALLYFWFTGCPPCVRIAPILAKLEQKYRASGILFLGINADEVLEISTSNESRISYVADQGLEFNHVNLDRATQEAFGNINVYPTIFILDKSGKVVQHLVNFQSEQKLDELLMGLAAN